MLNIRDHVIGPGNSAAFVRQKMASAANAVIRPLGVRLVRSRDASDGYRESARSVPLPPGAIEYLSPANPRLVQLVREYAGHPATRHHLWGQQRLTSRRLDLRYFRDDNVYVWQRRGMRSEAEYLVSAEYVKQYDQLGLLETLCEDGWFGAHTFDADGTTVSRDLLDSIIELGFLVRMFGKERFNTMRILDIGAGYGRLAHRTMSAFPEHEPVLCTDAVPISTFLCEYYLDLRGLGAKTKTVPLPQVQETMASVPVDLATNIHSFSECRYDSIVWWLDLLREHEVKHLFLVPNSGNRLISTEPNGVRKDFGPALAARGYQLVHREPKYSASPASQRCGLYPSIYHLFELRS